MEQAILENDEIQNSSNLVGMENDIANILNLFSSSQLLDGNCDYLLSLEEEVLLSNLVQDGEIAKIEMEKGGKETDFLKRKIEIGKLAINIFIVANQGLVCKIAKELTGKKNPPDDIIQEGTMGVIKAAKRLDNSKGYRFATYSSWRIKQHIILSIKKNKTIIAPVNVSGDSSTLKKMLKDNNLKAEKISSKDIDKLVKIGVFKREYILDLISVIKNENLLSLDWKNNEGVNVIYNKMSDKKNGPEENYFENQKNKRVRNNVKKLFLENKEPSHNKRGIIISLRNSIIGLNEEIIESLVKLTIAGNIQTIERTSTNLIDFYMKHKDEILNTLRNIAKNEETISEEQNTIINELCEKIEHIGDDFDMIVNEFREKNNTTEAVPKN